MPTWSNKFSNNVVCVSKIFIFMCSSNACRWIFCSTLIISKLNWCVEASGTSQKDEWPGHRVYYKFCLQVRSVQGNNIHHHRRGKLKT